MQVFISWSGDGSREVADVLARFLPHVVRGVSAFVSTQDIDAGERWENRLSEELERTHHAILCVTRDNQRSPWLNYEAGALGKLLGRSKVVPYTLGFPPGEMEVGPPISRFQGVENDESGTWNLVRSLNRAMSNPNEEAFVREDFELWWPRLREQMSQVLAKGPDQAPEAGPTVPELLYEMRGDLKRLLDAVSQLSDIDTRTAIDILESARQDALTKLPSRVVFSERASELEASSTPYVIAYLDLDHFKGINDAMGHAKGDELLKLVASTIKDELSSAAMIARLGGDEFAVLYVSTPPEAVANALRKLLAKLSTISVAAGFPAVTASAGVSTDRIEPMRLKLRDADVATYKAKSEGRAHVKMAT